MVKENLNIVVFTINYPFNKPLEHSFLKEELLHLQSSFKKVYVVPLCKEKGEKADLPANIILMTSLANDLNSIGLYSKLKLLGSFVLIKELLHKGRSWTNIYRAVSFMLNALVVERWIKNFLNIEVETANTVFYSFWNDISTLGMVLAKKKHGIKAVTRCHNFDLYGNEESNYYVPYFDFVFKNLNMVFADSYYGQQYLKTMCPKAKLENGIMGVADPGFVNTESRDGVFRIVSCAYMIPRKRIELFVKGLALASKENADLNLHWYHIGAGPLWEDIKKLSHAILPPNCKASFLGNLTFEDMMRFYKTTPLDLFVNTSAKEGTPVSLMEAISCGIPVLVTEFGGNKEIAEKGAGYLLSENPTEIEIGNALLQICKSDNIKGMRNKSKSVWNNHYNSELNYIDFCRSLKSI